MKFIVTGGGTGGHVYPAISIIEQLKEIDPSVRIVYFGQDNSIEETATKKANIEFIPIKSTSIMGKNIFGRLAASFKILLSGLSTLRMMRRVDCDAVIGTGGFAMGPTMVAAFLLRKPIFLHEQNVVPGLGNRFFCRFAKKVYISFDKTKESLPCSDKKILLTGNPVRQDFEIPYQEKSSKQKYILSLGGSGGSKTMNDFMVFAKDYISKKEDMTWIHITGNSYYKEYIDQLKDVNNLEVRPYISNIVDYYRRADLVIVRSGAISLAEISALGKASIMVPSPNVSHDHQTKNAQYFEKNKATVLIRDDELISQKSLEIIDDLLTNEDKIKEMQINAKKLSFEGASRLIATSILEEVRK